ncbi:MAG: transglutaminase family protein [Gammaproteobacteria bacterium]|nr:MAG: transglutaminase family protein [Gammaproteobacteria bacterium]
MLYDITLKITYQYDNDADASRHIVRLVPADIPGEQRLVAGTLTVRPKPDEWINRVDFFGNHNVELAFLDLHREITFSVQSRVERMDSIANLDMSPHLAELAGEIAAHQGVDSWAPHHFLGPSLRVPIEPATTGYARELLKDDFSVLDTIKTIGKALYRDMRYDPEATTVETPMLEAFNNRHGVCQDFSHIMIACLRGIGIPAGYVSGFLRTIPPKGKERLEGADAMHAWVRAWCGNNMGWVEFDPTNDMLAGTDHVVIARGRDYSDVAPIKGVMRTHGEHTSKQSVDVIPVSEKT